MERAEYWWKQGAIYQIVVPSFLDTTGNGMGDLRGILDRLDYVQWLGLRAIWLSPFYASPLRDMGYDVTDHTAVDPRFGTLDDFDQLLREAHRRDIKVVLDWIPNHTSDQHPWFLESRSSRDNPRRDWYVWRDPKPDGSPPTNWLSGMGGDVWQWDEPTGQYYMHLFLPQQPDLNWRNAEVREAMLDVLRFWLDRGVDGFRVDATSQIVKDDQFRDNPPNPDYKPGDACDQKVLSTYTRNQPLVHEILAECRRLVDQYGGDRLLAGEMFVSLDQLMEYYGREDRPELHLPFNLSLAFTPWDPQKWSETIEYSERRRPAHGWPSWMLSTHDWPRIASRVPGEQARVLAMLLYTLPGTPTHYYGEEVGMRGVDIPPEEALDPQGRRAGRNRDPARTPMQWDGSPKAGFTTGQPWLPIGDDAATNNVAVQRDDPRSILSLYRRLIALGRDEPALSRAHFEPLRRQPSLLVYRLSHEDRRLLVVLNSEPKPEHCELGEPSRGRILLSTHLDREGEEVRDQVEVRADEGVIVTLDAPSGVLA